MAVAQRIVPALGDVSIIRTWAGPNLYTPDGRPILGAVPDRPGLFVAVCNTYGFTLGPQCGLLLAKMLAGRPSTFDPTTFSIARFSSNEAATDCVANNAADARHGSGHV